MQSLDVIIVGAGPAGIGLAVELSKHTDLDYAILERGGVGESFRRWPKQTRLITPSFNSSPFGLADLNAVDSQSSPAIFAGTEHLSGQQYADYLTFIADAWNMPIACDCEVIKVTAHTEGGFTVETNHGELFTQFLVWACGESQFPDLHPFSGAQLCRHYATIEDWQTLEYGPHLVIGGYESGIDAAFNLTNLGHKVSLLARTQTWDLPDVYDPSQSLSPYSRERLRSIEGNTNFKIIFDADVVEVHQEANGQYRVHTADGRYWDTEHAPILGTGFIKGGGATQIKDLWLWDDDGRIMLTNNDESIHTPGLFLVGPQVRHDQLIYCFIYKFRQRFARISHQISLRLGLDTDTPGLPDNTWGPFGNSECCEGCEC
jgi:thioredoxin reductase